MMEIKEVAKIHELISGERHIEAANAALVAAGKNPVVKNRAAANVVLKNLVQAFLDNDLYLHAATLQWGPDVFLSDPESITRSFTAMHEGSMILFMGASSMGKTYGAGAWMLLDYLRDPLYTTVKLAAVNEDHLKKNLFAHVLNLFRACAVPIRDDIVYREADMWIGIKDAGHEFGISGIAFKQSQETSGQFKGYKAKPVRPKRHPRFGKMGRLRVLGDEGQNWPGGPFKDFNSLVASKIGSDLIKVAIAFNPESVSQYVVQMAEPEQGWNLEDLDTLYDWESRAGWRVCRLDAALCENVIQRKVVYPGLQTYEGFMSYLKSGGDSSPNYMTFARGFPPMKGTHNTIIPPGWPQSQRGEATFIENPINVAACDLAFMGEDSAQMAVGRWGLASGWRDHRGQRHTFMDRVNTTQPKARHVLQIDQIIPLEKHDDTTIMAEEIIARCKMLEIKPEWVAVDKTSIGLGTYSHMQRVWGDVYGIGWNEKATEKKILSEDKEPASSQCDGISSEMWWAFRRWLDPVCCGVLINTIIPTQPIQTQLTSRRYTTGKNGIKVEPKDQYKARNQKSPDEADAFVMMVHIVRKNSDVIPGLVEETKPQSEVLSGTVRPNFYKLGSVIDSQADEDDAIGIYEGASDSIDD